MGKTVKKTHFEFIKEMQIKHPNLIILNKYINSKTRIKYRCNKCGLMWSATAAKLSLGRGCPQCAGNKLKTHQEYIKQVSQINPDVAVMEQYVSTSKKICFKCKVCGYEWKTYPGSIIQGKGCYMCSKKNMGIKQRKDYKEFEREISIINPNIVLLNKYKKDKEKILCLCKICNGEWLAWPSILKGGHSCPYCKFSKGEKKIEKILKVYDVEFISQYKPENLFGIGGGKLSYDFYIPEYNILIEYQGKQHKQPIEYFGGEEVFKRQKEHDRRKREFAFRNNMKLIEIWYYEDIEKKIKKALNLETVTTTGY